MFPIPSFPMPREMPLDPPAAYKLLRGGQPVVKARLANGRSAWLVTRYDDVRAVLGDAKRFSVMPTRGGYPMFSAGRAEFLTKERPTLNRVDPPEHTKLRRMLMREFMVRRIEEKGDYIEKLVADLLDKMEAKGAPADIVDDLALPLPTLVISDMLGLPYDDHDFLQEKTSLKMVVSSEPGRQTPAEAQQEIMDYIDRLLRQRLARPDITNDIFGRLIAEQVRPGHISIEDAVALAELLVVAGHETTANMIAMGTLLLMQHPDQLAALRAQPELIPKAIEEMLRFLTVTHLHCARVALEDVEIGGQTILAGEGLFALLSSANRDDAAFSQPEKFDIGQSGKSHMAFGFGIHQCIGQTLARIELEIVFRRLLAKFPNLKLAAGADETSYKLDSFVIGLHHLPVSW